MSNALKTKRNATAPVQRMPSPGRSKMPPGSSSEAPTQLKGDPKIKKSDRKDAEMGPVREGPIAERGAGDAHAFAANDVNQGGLGDCYFLSSLCSIANSDPGLLEKAISKKDDGSYDVKLYKRKGLFGGGSWEAQTVNVTASFVVHKDTDIDYYANGGDRDGEWNQELWVKLMEKAYAKMHGGYGKIHGGWDEDALGALTGQEFERKNIHGGLFGIGKMSEADVKKNIKDAVSAGEPVNASTKKQGKIDKADKAAGITFAADNDIVGRHSYAVMEASDSKIKLRNPWGSGAKNAEPELDWSQFRSYYLDFTTKKD